MTKGERRALAAIVRAFWAGLRPEPSSPPYTQASAKGLGEPAR
jgi:hypothetical protein